MEGKTIYRSKTSIVLLVFLIAVFAVTSIPVLAEGITISGILLFILPMAFVWYVFSSIKYTIADDVLSVSAFLLKEDIPIKDITEIKKTKTLLASPAGSLDRIWISYGRYGAIVISPRNRKIFLAHLLKINPDIELDSKLQE